MLYCFSCCSGNKSDKYNETSNYVLMFLFSRMWQLWRWVCNLMLIPAIPDGELWIIEVVAYICVVDGDPTCSTWYPISVYVQCVGLGGLYLCSRWGSNVVIGYLVASTLHCSVRRCLSRVSLMEQSPARMCATLFSAVGMAETWYGTIYQSNIVVTDGPPEALTIKQVSI